MEQTELGLDLLIQVLSQFASSELEQRLRVVNFMETRRQEQETMWKSLALHRCVLWKISTSTHIWKLLLRIARLWKTTSWQEVNVQLRKENFISTSTDIAFKSIKELKNIKKKLRTTNFYNYDRCADADSCCDFSRPWIFACRIAAKSEPCRLDKISDIFRIAICLPEWDFDDVIGDAVLYSSVLLKLIL